MSTRCTRFLLRATMMLVAAAPASAQQTVTLPAKDVALTDRPADVFAVGTVQGREWEMFSGIRSLAFDSHDNLHVLDGQNHRVIVLDADGGFLRQFGKQGGGPGELQAPLALGLTGDDNIVISDLGNRAFIVFSPAGEHVRNVPFDDQLGFPLGMIVDGTSVLSRASPRMRPGQAPDDNARFSTIFRQALADGEPQTTTLFRVPVDPPRVIDAGGSGGARRVAAIRMDPVFGARPTFGPLPNGLALHHETEYGIRILDAGGRHVRTIARDFRPKKVTKKDQQEWQKRREADEANGDGPTMIAVTQRGGGAAGGSVSIGGRGAPPPGAMRLSLEDTPFAEFMSVVTSIRTDPQGRIWVQRRHDDGSDEGPIDLVTAEGRYIGTLPPQPLPDAVSASGLAAWIEHDELGVERVVVRRLPASWH